MHQVDLSKANLRDADLEKSNLDETNLSGAIYNSGTKWPDGFEPELAGAFRKE